MDFTKTGSEGLVVGSSSSSSSCSPFISTVDPEDATRLLYGSGLFKADKSCGTEDEWRRSSKLAKISDDDLCLQLKEMAQKSCAISNNTPRSLFSDAPPPNQLQMFCFSSPKSVDSTLPLLNCPLPSSPYSSSPGFNFGRLTGANHHHHSMAEGVCTRSSFTPSQWMELEHQALIYKYINANIPVPFNLLIPIKKAFESAGFSCYPTDILRSNSLGWGSFHLGFTNNRDTEPGRCRRTDGKKWRCSRDAVADQKYCERHINRGRHRSRKTVEGQSGHEAATSGSTVASSASVYNNRPSSLSADNTINNRFLMINKDNTSEKSPLPPQQPPRSSSNDDDLSLLSFGNLGTLKELTGGGRTHLSNSTSMASSMGGPLGEALHKSVASHTNTAN